MTVARFSLLLLLAAPAGAAEPQLLWSGALYSEACVRLGDDGVIESAAGSRSGDITATIEGGDAVLEAARACARSSAKAADLGALMNEDGPEWWAFKTGFAACLKDAGIAARVGQPALATYESCAWPG